MRLAAELRRVVQRHVAVGQIMGAATVAKLAALLSDEGSADDAANAGFAEVLTLRAGHGAPLFCIHPASGFAWQYAGLARYLPPHLPLIGLQSPRPSGAIAASVDMDAVCERHLATLRRAQHEGPYRLLGYSLGGTVAQGIAARLRARLGRRSSSSACSTPIRRKGRTGVDRPRPKPSRRSNASRRSSLLRSAPMTMRSYGTRRR